MDIDKDIFVFISVFVSSLNEVGNWESAAVVAVVVAVAVAVVVAVDSLSMVCTSKQV